MKFSKVEEDRKKTFLTDIHTNNAPMTPRYHAITNVYLFINELF